MTHTHTPQSLGLPEQGIGASQRPLPDNTQLSQATEIRASDEIQTRNPSKQVAADPRLTPPVYGFPYCTQKRSSISST